MDMMKKDIENRIGNFSQELEKFAARWHQLKPSNVDVDSDKKKCMEAVESIKERRAEFDEIVKNKEKLWYASLKTKQTKFLSHICASHCSDLLQYFVVASLSTKLSFSL